MLPISVTLKFKGFDALANKVYGARRRVHMAAGREFWLITREAFGANKPNRPAPWRPLSEPYKRALRAKSFGTPLIPTLLRAGTLLNSIRFAADSSTARIWSNCPYAAVHQFGGGPVPARPYLPIEPASGGWKLTPYAESRIYPQVIRALSGQG